MLSRVLRSGLLYCGMVFSAGFALGTVRVLLLEPQIGARYAELIEMPLMLCVIYFSARYVVSKTHPASGNGLHLSIGLLALALLLLLECTLVLWLQGVPVNQYLASRDTIALAAYLLSLGLFALMPLIIKIRMHKKTLQCFLT